MEVGVGHDLEGFGGGIEDLDFCEDVGDLLAVGADVLDGGGTSETGDFAEGFDASKAAGAGVVDDIVPVFAAHDLYLLSETGVVTCPGSAGDATEAVDDDDAVKTCIVANGVGAVAEDKDWQILLFGKIISVGDVGLGFNFNDITSRATETHGSKTRNQNIFVDAHGCIIT